MIPLIKLSGIVKSYPDGSRGRREVLRGVDAEIAAGEFVAVRGPSGAGKSTLLAILGTLLAPDAGSYLFDGEEMTAPGIDLPSIRNRGIGFVFQDHRLLPQYTALENILLPTLASSPRSMDEQIAHARRLLEITGIEQVADQYPPSLSGGEAGRVAVCRALVMKPRMVLADEPTGQLDSVNARNMVTLLGRMCHELGTTVVMVTHSPEAAGAADRTVELYEGVLR
jgi:ABC-type lipoprotein export system ATPase subunit